MKLLKSLLKDEKEVVKEIHDSFDNAQEELLNQALAIIQNHEIGSDDKAERLEKLGFKNSETVVKYRKNKKKLIESKNDADLVNYYKSQYPFLKFLKESQLDNICKKYNLIYAPVDRYKKDVPKKNILEIENAQPLRPSDEEKEINYLKIDDNEFVSGDRKLYNKFKKQFVKVDRVSSWGLSGCVYKGNPIDEYFKVRWSFTGYETKKEIREGLFIAAPKSHFNLKGLNKNGLGFFSVSIKEVKDPIVFRYVKGGIQVLSKWGLEADDEMLTQENLN